MDKIVNDTIRELFEALKMDYGNIAETNELYTNDMEHPLSANVVDKLCEFYYDYYNKSTTPLDDVDPIALDDMRHRRTC